MYTFTQTQLLEEYINKNKTQEQLCEEFNLSKSSFKEQLRKFNIHKSTALRKVLAKTARKNTTNRHWYNNGEIEVFEFECPANFKPGMLKSRVEKMHTNWKLTKNGLKKLQQIGSTSFKNKCHTIETKNKISYFWKTHIHPNKGKKRPQETKDKISKKLLGHLQASPKRDKIQTLSKEQLLCYLYNDLTINFNKIFEDLNLPNNQDSVLQIYKRYNQLDVIFKHNTRASTFEKEVMEFILDNYTGEVEEHNRALLNGLEIDIYIPEFKLAVECNGVFWHRTDYIKDGNTYKYTKICKSPTYHSDKSKLAYSKGIRIINIWEDQWQNPRTQSVLKSILKAALHCNDVKKIYARKCEIREVSLKEYIEFCNTYHIQKARFAKIRLGLFYENTLVQVASFNKFNNTNRKKTKETYDYEFVRGCDAFNHSRVIGGVSKLFTHFVKTFNPKSVLCYSDFNLFYGLGYAKCGFKFEGFTKGDKFYVEKNTLQRISRNAKKYKEYMNNVVNKKWFCCYGAGNLKFVWYKNTTI